MITKAIVRAINGAGNRCIVRMPLFETASDMSPVEAEALVSITPGFFNNIFVGDVVFVGFEENALEKPIILGKLYKGTSFENETPGGMGIVDSLMVRTKASTPAITTEFRYPADLKEEYKHFTSPKKIADYIKWLETLLRNWLNRLEKQFKCFKSWTQWQLQPENVEIDDGDIDSKNYTYTEAFLYQEEGAECKVCKACLSSAENIRKYPNIVDEKKQYPQL